MVAVSDARAALVARVHVTADAAEGAADAYDTQDARSAAAVYELAGIDPA
jgi:hypothetical protein